MSFRRALQWSSGILPATTGLLPGFGSIARCMSTADTALFQSLWDKYKDNTVVLGAQPVKEWMAEGNQLTSELFRMLHKRLRNNGRFDEASKVLLWTVQEKPFELTPGEYVQRIALAGRQRKLALAKSIFDSAPRELQNSEVSTALLGAFASQNELDKAQSIFRSFTPTTAEAYNTMILMYLRMGFHDKAGELAEVLVGSSGVELDELSVHILAKHRDELKMEPNVEQAEEILMTTLSKIWTYSDRVAAAKNVMLAFGYLKNANGVELMWDAVQKDKALLHECCPAAIRAFALAGDVERAKLAAAKVKEARRNEKDFLPALVFLYANNGMMDEALNIVRGVNAKELKTTYEIYDELVSGYLRQDQPAKALGKLKESYSMVKLNGNLSYETVLSLLPAFAKYKDVLGAETMVNSYKGWKDIRLFNGLLKVYVRGKKRVYEFEQRLRSAKVEPNEETMELLSRVQRRTLTNQKLDDSAFWTSGIRLHRRLFHSGIVRLQKESEEATESEAESDDDDEKINGEQVNDEQIDGELHKMWKEIRDSNFRKCLEIFQRWQSKVSRIQFRHLLSRLKHRSCHAAALEILEWAKENSLYEFEPRDVAFEISLLSKLHKVTKAQRLYNELPADMKNEEVTEALIVAYTDHNMLHKAESLLESVSARTSKIYDKMINMYLRIGMDDRVEETYNELKESSTATPTLVTFMILMTNRDRFPGIENVEEDVKAFLGALSAESEIPQRKRTHAMILYASIGNVEKVDDLWSNISSTMSGRVIQVASYLCAMKAYSLVGNMDQAEKLYQDALVAKPRSLRKLSLQMIRLHCRVGDIKRAEELVAGLGVLKGNLRSSVYNGLVMGYLDNDDRENALKTLKKAYADPRPGFKAEYRTVLGLMKVYEELGDIDAAHRIVRSFGERGDAKLYNALLRLCIKVKKVPLEYAFRFLGKDVKPNEETLELQRTIALWRNLQREACQGFSAQNAE